MDYLSPHDSILSSAVHVVISQYIKVLVDLIPPSQSRSSQWSVPCARPSDLLYSSNVQIVFFDLLDRLKGVARPVLAQNVPCTDFQIRVSLGFHSFIRPNPRLIFIFFNKGFFRGRVVNPTPSPPPFAAGLGTVLFFSDCKISLLGVSKFTL